MNSSRPRNASGELQTDSSISRNVFVKLKEQAGESIAEVLMAALVVALGSIVLVSMITASGRIVRKSSSSYNQYIVNRNALEKRGSDSQDGDSASAAASDAKLTITLDRERSQGTAPEQTSLEEKIRLYMIEESDLYTYDP